MLKWIMIVKKCDRFNNVSIFILSNEVIGINNSILNECYDCCMNIHDSINCVDCFQE